MLLIFVLLVILAKQEEFLVTFENDEWVKSQSSNREFTYTIELIKKKYIYIDITMNEINDEFYLIYSYNQLAEINTYISQSLEYDKISIIDQRNTRFLKIPVQNSSLYVYVLDKYQTTNYLIQIKQSDQEICEAACFSRGDCTIDGCNCYINEDQINNYVGNNCNRKASKIVENTQLIKLDSEIEEYFYIKLDGDSLKLQFLNQYDSCVKFSQIPQTNNEEAFDFKICKNQNLTITPDISQYTKGNNFVFKIKLLSAFGNGSLNLLILEEQEEPILTTSELYIVIFESILNFLIIILILVLLWKYKKIYEIIHGFIYQTSCGHYYHKQCQADENQQRKSWKCIKCNQIQ